MDKDEYDRELLEIIQEIVNLVRPKDSDYSRLKTRIEMLQLYLDGKLNP